MYIKKNSKLIFIIIILIVVIFILYFVYCLINKNVSLNQEPETVELLQMVLSDAYYYYYNEDTQIYIIYDNGKDRIGYAFYAEGMGTGVSKGELGVKIPGKIIILVGIEDKEKLTGIHIIEQHETATFWKLLINVGYLDQFKGINIEDLYFNKDGGEIDSVSGATISSTSILEIIREAVIEKIQYIN
jgi:Na+-translocating ferredoxin:NAD+ oxidoreductase subunit G